jgi:hypothetical protein
MHSLAGASFLALVDSYSREERATLNTEQARREDSPLFLA